MNIRSNCFSQWMCSVLDKASISNPKSARLLAIPFLPYTFFVKAISPFTSVYSNIQDIRSINRELLNPTLDDEKRSDLDAAKKMRQISLIKSTVCALIFPLYALISTIIFIAQIIMNPLFAARRNHPIYKTRLEELSIFERKEAKSITDKNKHNTDLLQQELQKRIIFVREYIDSLSINELQSIANPLKRFDDVMKFSAFKADKRAQNPGIEFEEIFKLMEKFVYSSEEDLDFLFNSAKSMIDTFPKIDSYKSDNIDDADLCRARKFFKENIIQFLKQKKFDTDKAIQKVINNLVKIYQDEKELKSTLKHTSDREALKLALHESQVLLIKGRICEIKDNFLYFKIRPMLLNQIEQYKKDQLKLIPQSDSNTKELMNNICDSIQKDIKDINSKYTYSYHNEYSFTKKIHSVIEPLKKLFLKFKRQDDQDLLVSQILDNEDPLPTDNHIYTYFKEKLFLPILVRKNIRLHNIKPETIVSEKVNLDLNTIDDIWNDVASQLSPLIQQPFDPEAKEHCKNKLNRQDIISLTINNFSK